MSEVTINIDDYLTDEDRREIAKEEFRAICRRRSQVDFERILSNSAYDLVRREVDAVFDGKMAETVQANAVKIINNLSSYTIFSPPNAWDKQATKGWELLQSAIEAARPEINERVLAIVAELNADELRERLDGVIGDVIVSRLTGQ